MGDLAFVQHMVATLNAKGVCGVVMPHGVLFRGSGDGRIREAMLKADLFEAIIGLPENLFAGTGIPATVLILNKAKAPERKGKVLFIHGAKKFEERPKRTSWVKAISGTFVTPSAPGEMKTAFAV